MGGTTLEDPVTVEQKPDLTGSAHEIQEYLNEQNAYDLFEYLVKELVTVQPKDPLQHMLQCLQADHPSNIGPLKIVVTSAPASCGRKELSKKLAAHFGLAYIAAGDLLRETNVNTDDMSYAEDTKISESVMEQVKMATDKMQGFVLDGFPRTRIQATFLKERSVVPTHVLLLKTTEEQIMQRQKMIQEGIVDGVYIPPEVLTQKLRVYTCHASSALESYADKIQKIDTTMGEAHVWAEMERCVRMVPRSNAPKLPPRIVMVGPRGVGVREHASRLAARLGAVFVDGASITTSTAAVTKLEARAIQDDPLGRVGLRLRQPDCTQLGWVMCGFPSVAADASLLRADSHLAPTRVLAFVASSDTCVHRLRHHYLDPISGKVWTTMPRNQQIRQRLQHRPEDKSDAVTEMHAKYMKNIDSILDQLGTDGKCTKIAADAAPLSVFTEVVDFVERPLPLR